MNTVTKSAQLLIPLGQHYWGDDENKPAEFIPFDAIKIIKAELDDLKLSRDDIILIASVFGNVPQLL